MNFIYSGFEKKLAARYGAETAKRLRAEAEAIHAALKREHPKLKGDAAMMILPAAAWYRAVSAYAKDDALPLLREYGAEVGERIARILRAITSIPGLPKLLWKHMPALMRSTSSPQKGYTRRIVSENDDLVGVDILSCPLYDAAVAVGVPEAAQAVCAMDQKYMQGFRNIRYTRTMSVAEGGICCDYRLQYDESKR